jgi:TRAP transporter TAXI family solute receptor
MKAFGKYLSLLGAVTLALGLFAVSSASAQTRLYLGASKPGGGWYPTMSLIKEVLEKNISGLVTTVGTEGGRANAALVGTGRADLGFTGAGFAKAAFDGKTPYKKAYKNLRTLYSFAKKTPFYFVVTKDTGITSAEQVMKGGSKLKVVIDQPGSTGYTILKNLMSLYGVTFDSYKASGTKLFPLPRGEVVSFIRDGHGNAYFTSLNEPASGITELATVKNVVFLPVGADKVKAAIKFGYTPYTIKKGVYPKLASNVSTTGSGVLTVVKAELPADLVYKITKALVEKGEKVRNFKAGKFDLKTMAKNPPVPLHPGAEKYYREKGML